MRSTSSSKPMPAAFAAMGTRLSSVIPGSVLTSRQYGSPSSGQPEIDPRVIPAGERPIGERRLAPDAFRRFRVELRRSDVAARPFRVFPLVVVEAPLGDDLDEGKRFPPEDRRRDLASRDVSLDDALAAEAPRQPQRLVEILRAGNERESDARSLAVGFHDDGISERARDRRSRSRAFLLRRRVDEEDAGRSGRSPRGRAPSSDPCSSRARSRVFRSRCRRSRRSRGAPGSCRPLPCPRAARRRSCPRSGPASRSATRTSRRPRAARRSPGGHSPIFAARGSALEPTGSAGSTAWTSCPPARSAFRIAAPLASETSRSGESPPRRTVTFISRTFASLAPLTASPFRRARPEWPEARSPCRGSP